MRYQSAADLRTDLARLKRDLDSGRSSAPPFRECGGGSAVRLRFGAAAPSARKYWRAGRGLVLIVAALRDSICCAEEETPKVTSIAVLPFVNATADPNNEYLSDGLTESLISTLSQLPGLKVMARSTVFHFKGNQEDPRQIGQALQVGAV